MDVITAIRVFYTCLFFIPVFCGALARLINFQAIVMMPTAFICIFSLCLVFWPFLLVVMHSMATNMAMIAHLCAILTATGYGFGYGLVFTGQYLFRAVKSMYARHSPPPKED